MSRIVVLTMLCVSRDLSKVLSIDDPVTRLMLPLKWRSLLSSDTIIPNRLFRPMFSIHAAYQ